jgi:hypothetical protein
LAANTIAADVAVADGPACSATETTAATYDRILDASVHTHALRVDMTPAAAQALLASGALPWAYLTEISGFHLLLGRR